MQRLPPLITREAFDTLGRLTSIDAVEREFGPSIRKELIPFLSSLDSLRDIQTLRRRWTRPDSKLPFENHNTDPFCWYLFHRGGRNELQFNVGMDSGWLRAGLGLEFSQKKGGNPAAVWNCLEALRQEIQTRSREFEGLIDSLKFEGERFLRGKTLERIRGSELLNRIMTQDDRTEWLFVGRLLEPDRDSDVFESRELLGEELGRVFAGLRPWWLAAMTRAKRNLP